MKRISAVLAVLTLVLGAIQANALRAQTLPAVSVWLAPLNDDLPGEPRRVSPPGGYHNQPMFAPDSGSLFFTSQASEGTDIKRYRLADDSLEVLNADPESDYSPTPIPGQQAIAVVRVEPDGKQRLWRIDLDSGQASLLLPGLEPVGYFCFMDAQTVAAFVLGEVMTLQVAMLDGQPPRVTAENIGRTLRFDPADGRLLFVDKNVEPWRIDAMTGDATQPAGVMDLFPEDEDFTLGPHGRFWTGDGSRLYRSRAGNDGWELMADFSETGIHTITRVAVSPDGRWLALASRE